MFVFLVCEFVVWLLCLVMGIFVFVSMKVVVVEMLKVCVLLFLVFIMFISMLWG